jgi:TPR repeat protein
VFLILASCGGGKKVDCDALAEHVGEVPHERAPAETDDQYEKRMRTIREGVRMMCTGGDISADQAACMRAAKDEAALDACSPLAMAVKAPAPAETKPAAPAKPAVPALPDPDGPDTPEHNKKLEDACHGGNGEACYFIASRIRRGVGVGDAELGELGKLSTPWYQKGCDLSDAWSCEKLATAYLFGEGVEQSQPKALELAQKACTADAARCAFLSKFHFGGVGGPKDAARGLELLEKACTAKNPDACGELAKRLMDGEDVTADPARAVKLATDSCAADERACWALGEFTEAGKGGITADENKGYQLRRTACLAGSNAACQSMRK